MTWSCCASHPGKASQAGQQQRYSQAKQDDQHMLADRRNVIKHSTIQ